MLPISEARIFNINDFIGWHEKGFIKLTKSCVWNEDKKAYLIDSLLSGYPIPPIYIHLRTDIKARKTIREIIDGNERINAIVAFCNDELTNKKYSALSQEEQSAFLNSNLCVWYIFTDNEQIIKEIFNRQFSLFERLP